MEKVSQHDVFVSHVAFITRWDHEGTMRRVVILSRSNENLQNANCSQSELIDSPLEIYKREEFERMHGIGRWLSQHCHIQVARPLFCFCLCLLKPATILPWDTQPREPLAKESESGQTRQLRHNVLIQQQQQTHLKTQPRNLSGDAARW